jgi:phospholipid/cholesterol/gamma-HCH transport system substrate-binding protein
METKANHFVIGVFVLGLVLAGMGFARWMVNGGLSGNETAYRVLFEGAISGLTPGGNVLFNGIKVGKVQSIKIHAADSRKVEVKLLVRAGVPVRTDSLAGITQTGITGFSAVQISAGDPAAPLLTANADGTPTDIRAKPAVAGSLMDAMPELLGNVNALFVRLNQLVESNEKVLTASMDGLRSFTDVLEKNKDEIDTTFKNVSAITASFRSSASRLDGIIGKVDGDLLSGKESIVAQAKDAMKALKSVSRRLDQTIGGNANQLAVSAKRSLQEIELLAKDGRRAVRSLDRILASVERNPQSLIFGDKSVPTYKPQ